MTQRPLRAGDTAYYCQPDGGQWNIPVRVYDTFPINPSLHQKSLIIMGMDLIGSFTDQFGYSWMIVDIADVYAVMQEECMACGGGLEPIKKWSEMFPNGRHVYYEGEDPEGFVKEMKAKFNFDPSKDNPNWSMWIDKEGDNPGFFSYGFDLPGHLMDAVYGGPYPLGS